MELTRVLSTRAEPEKPGTLFTIVKIDCAFTNNQMIPSGELLTQGVHYCKVPTRDMPKLLAMVEPHPEWIDQAAEAHKAAIEHKVRTARDAVEPIYRDETESTVRATFPGSVSGEFARQHLRDINPFRSVEVIEEGLLAEQDEQKLQIEEQQARRIAAAMGNGGAVVPLAEVQKMIDTALAKQAAQQSSQQNQKR